jgi:hypothetical protein
MSRADFTMTLQREMRPLLEGIFEELRRNPGTSHYHKLDSDELLKRGQAVYQYMLQWLMNHEEESVRTAAIELGKARFAEGIPLGQVVLAVLLEEKNLWNYPATSGFASDAELAGAVKDFFQMFIYWMAHSFSSELESGKPYLGRVVPPPRQHMPTAPSAHQQEADELITRGGQIAEFGG